MRMKLSIVLYSMCAFFLIGCETSEDSLLDFLSVEPNLPPAALEFTGTGASQPIIARINESNTIYGSGHGKRFYTTDYFQTINLSGNVTGEEFIELDGPHVLKAHHENSRLVLEESSNYGFSFNPKLTIPVGNADEYAFYFLTHQSGWVVREMDGIFQILKVEGDAVNVISSIESSSANPYSAPHSIHFTNATDGVLVLNNGLEGVVKSIFRTTDGGETWTGPFELSLRNGNSSAPLDFATIIGHNNLLYSAAEEGKSLDYLYVSRDGGLTWDFQQHEEGYEGLRGFQFLNDKVGYAIRTIEYLPQYERTRVASVGYLYKTTNGGATWAAASNRVIYGDRIFFLNENVGLAMSFGVLQLTRDGGKSWQLLLYPINALK